VRFVAVCEQAAHGRFRAIDDGKNVKEQRRQSTSRESRVHVELVNNII
jgi:hypothetical protein